MKRILGLSLAALAGTAVLTAAPAAAQERDNERYSVAENDDRESRSRERNVSARIPSGTEIAVTVDEDISVDRDNFGQTFDAHVDRDVEVRDNVVIPAGAPAKVKLVESSEKEDAATLRLTEVRVNGEMRDVAVSDAQADNDEGLLEGLNTGEKTAAGAAAGAVVGAVTGAGVLEGAVVGAGGGLAWGLLSDGGTDIDDGTTVRFELEEELETR